MANRRKLHPDLTADDVLSVTSGFKKPKLAEEALHEADQKLEEYKTACAFHHMMASLNKEAVEKKAAEAAVVPQPPSFSGAPTCNEYGMPYDDDFPVVVVKPKETASVKEEEDDDDAGLPVIYNDIDPVNTFVVMCIDAGAQSDVKKQGWKVIRVGSNFQRRYEDADGNVKLGHGKVTGIVKNDDTSVVFKHRWWNSYKDLIDMGLMPKAWNFGRAQYSLDESSEDECGTDAVTDAEVTMPDQWRHYMEPDGTVCLQQKEASVVDVKSDLTAAECNFRDFLLARPEAMWHTTTGQVLVAQIPPDGKKSNDAYARFMSTVLSPTHGPTGKEVSFIERTYAIAETCQLCNHTRNIRWLMTLVKGEKSLSLGDCCMARCRRISTLLLNIHDAVEWASKSMDKAALRTWYRAVMGTTPEKGWVELAPQTSSVTPIVDTVPPASVEDDYSLCG